MAIQGKKINELQKIDNLTLDTIFPVVKIVEGTAESTAKYATLRNTTQIVIENLPSSILKNYATNESELSILGNIDGLSSRSIIIGKLSRSHNGSDNVAIGYNSQIGGALSVNIGANSSINGESSVLIGCSSQSYTDLNTVIGTFAMGGIPNNPENTNNIAIGYNSRPNGKNCYLIGPGMCDVDNSFNIAFKQNQFYTLLNSDGKIPIERLPNLGGAPTLTWYKNITGNTIEIADTTRAQLVKIYKNGVLLEPTADYTISGTTLTLTTALTADDKITTEVY